IRINWNMRLQSSMLLWMCVVLTTNAQIESKPGGIVVCPAGHEVNHFRITPMEQSISSSRITQGSPAVFEVDYVGFSEEAKSAFQRAVDIWAFLIKSNVKIRVQATWEPLGSNTLGAAGATMLYRNFNNAP